ncbi:MAG: type II 3-dehydroquinate dehydratase [Candidatus Marinimicrobia bacterium]|nr:type II 3-dehydroquinate dehydratase [Candidatus Neomarinimicrobiota bacterium]
MKLLLLQGPNLNLLGVKAAESKNVLTLDKLNRAIKKHLHMKEVEIKILQTHKTFQAVNFIQRNRIWADGLIFIPTSWAKYEWTLFESIQLSKIKMVQIKFDHPYSFSDSNDESIFDSIAEKTFVELPVEACHHAVDYFLK